MFPDLIELKLFSEGHTISRIDHQAYIYLFIQLTETVNFLNEDHFFNQDG